MTLTNTLAVSTRGASAVDALALHETLERLSSFRPRAAQVVELRYFGGLSLEHTAEVLGVTAKTVGRDWQAARLWLLDRLQATPGP